MHMMHALQSRLNRGTRASRGRSIDAVNAALDHCILLTSQDSNSVSLVFRHTKFVS